MVSTNKLAIISLIVLASFVIGTGALLEVYGLSFPQQEKYSTFFEPHGLIIYTKNIEDDALGKTVFYVWNPENKNLTFTNPFVLHGYTQYAPEPVLHETYLHWQIINTTISSYLWVEGIHQINSTTTITEKEFLFFNYWYEREQQQNEIIKALEDKLGKQGKRIKLLEAAIINGSK